MLTLLALTLTHLWSNSFFGSSNSQFLVAFLIFSRGMVTGDIDSRPYFILDLRFLQRGCFLLDQWDQEKNVCVLPNTMVAAGMGKETVLCAEFCTSLTSRWFQLWNSSFLEAVMKMGYRFTNLFILFLSQWLGPRHISKKKIKICIV